MDDEYRLSTNKYTFSLDGWIRFLPKGGSITQYSMPWYYDVPFANATHLEAYQLKTSSEHIRAAFELFWTTRDGTRMSAIVVDCEFLRTQVSPVVEVGKEDLVLWYKQVNERLKLLEIPEEGEIFHKTIPTVTLWGEEIHHWKIIRNKNFIKDLTCFLNGVDQGTMPYQNWQEELLKRYNPFIAI